MLRKDLSSLAALPDGVVAVDLREALRGSEYERPCASIWNHPALARVRGAKYGIVSRQWPVPEDSKRAWQSKLPSISCLLARLLLIVATGVVPLVLITVEENSSATIIRATRVPTRGRLP